MPNIYWQEIQKLTHSKQTDQKLIKQFNRRLLNRNDLTKEDNIVDHLCTFFVPINIETKSVYLGHHKKADDWIPPGGHIKKDEHPIETVKREFFEELSHELIDEKIELFDLSVKHIDNSKHNCKIHYDIWYLVFTEKKDFNFLKKEFYDANWFLIDKAVQLTQAQNYNNIIKKIFQ